MDLEIMRLMADRRQFESYKATSQAIAASLGNGPSAITSREDGVFYATGPTGGTIPVIPAYRGASVGDVVSIRGGVANAL
jgi:hypothetical protein